MEHNHVEVANTKAAINSFVGCTLKEAMYDQMPIYNAAAAETSITLVFDCGWGLTINRDRGNFWVDNPEDIKKAGDKRLIDLAQMNLDVFMHQAGEV